MRSGILLVDDDAEDQFIFCDAMESIDQPRPVHIECCGVDALNYLSSLAPDQLPCLVLADLNMPKMNGNELLRQLKSDERFRNIPVVIYTTSVNEFEKYACLRLGAEDYITKPLSYTQSIEVAQMITNLCGRLQPPEAGATSVPQRRSDKGEEERIDKKR
jgi:CheY-like chemotaxis protein